MKRTIFSLAVAWAAFLAVSAIEDNTVEIVYSEESATVIVANNISDYVTVKSDNSSHVVLVQSSAVNDKVGEITYLLSGTSADGEFFLEGTYKATIELNGLTLTNPKGPAINLQDGKRMKVSVKNGTVNTLADGANDNYNGCLHCKGHTEFKGKGTLNVTGNSRHAIYSKEYLEIKNCTINIKRAVKDAIHCKQFFYMESGAVSIDGGGDDGLLKNIGDDGIQVELEEATSTGVMPEHEDEDTGNFYQTGGTLSIKGYTGKAIKADGTISFTPTLSKQLNFDKSDTQENAAAGIEQLTSTDAGLSPATVYDLSGRRIAQEAMTARQPKGLLIIKKGNNAIKQIIR